MKDFVDHTPRIPPEASGHGSADAGRRRDDVPGPSDLRRGDREERWDGAGGTDTPATGTAAVPPPVRLPVRVGRRGAGLRLGVAAGVLLVGGAVVLEQDVFVPQLEDAREDAWYGQEHGYAATAFGGSVVFDDGTTLSCDEPVVAPEGGFYEDLPPTGTTVLEITCTEGLVSGTYRDASSTLAYVYAGGLSTTSVYGARWESPEGVLTPGTSVTWTWTVAAVSAQDPYVVVSPDIFRTAVFR